MYPSEMNKKFTSGGIINFSTESSWDDEVLLNEIHKMYVKQSLLCSSWEYYLNSTGFNSSPALI